MGLNACSYKGFMLDVSRHFMPVENIKKLIEAAKLCGLNRMHWHLADDQGWRIEIKKYPKLTEIGSVRGRSFFGDVSETENNCGFYTQEQVRELIIFAQSCGIEIIPEIEVPGHASAMLSAYPQFGCRRTVIRNSTECIVDEPYHYKVLNVGGIFPNLLCAGKDESINFLKDILDEIAELFPASAIHIGGDEALKQHWRRCPDCQRRILEEGLKNEEELQRWLVLNIGEYLAQKGKNTIVYNDSLSGGMLPKHFIVQHWMGNDRETAEFMSTGGKVICSDIEHYYFDYPYSSIDVHHIFQTPAVPAYAEGYTDNLLGVECMLWTERITNIERASYLLFPRLPAVALKVGKGETFHTWEEYTEALRKMQCDIASLGLYGAPKQQWKMSPEEAEKDRLLDKKCRTASGALQAIEEEERLLLQEELEKLLKAIDMPKTFALSVMDYAWKRLPDYCGTEYSDISDGADEMAEQLLIALQSREKGMWSKLSEDIWIETMKCFSRFVNEYYCSYGKYGFDRGFWTTRQINAKLFRIGELEYELCENTIGIHIPSDTQLKEHLLQESMVQARQFLKEWFPKWADAPMECTSWLLSPVLKEMLSGNSNILQFQKAFEIVSVDMEPNDVLEWAFKLTDKQQKEVCLDKLPEETSLQKKIKEYLLKGGKVGVAKGIWTWAEEKISR